MCPTVDQVVVGITEKKVSVGFFGARYPDGPLGKQESSSKFLDLRAGRNDLVQRRIFPGDLRGSLADRNFGRLVEIERCRLDPDEVLRAVGDRAIDPEDGKLNALAGLGVPGKDHAIGSVESFNHRPARLTQDPRHLAVDPDLSIVVDHDFKSDCRSCGAEVRDLFRNRDVDAVPVETDLGRGTPLVKSRGIDGFPLRIVEVRGARVRSVVVRPDRCAARLQVGTRQRASRRPRFSRRGSATGRSPIARLRGKPGRSLRPDDPREGLASSVRPPLPGRTTERNPSVANALRICQSCVHVHVSLSEPSQRSRGTDW